MEREKERGKYRGMKCRDTEIDQDRRRERKSRMLGNEKDGGR